MVPEQAIHEGILRLHHCITSTKHSSGAEERYAKENIVHYVRRCRNYMFAYLEGSGVGHELEDRIKFYKSVSYTSHRQVGIND